ncbi:MAG: hypothetical protein LKJ17_04665 [Oscillospiraceae bacterium]|nr:hypothetical protein [Oscillospiraceae bacterium]
MDFHPYGGVSGGMDGFALPINQDFDESYFLSLPEETQQKLLKQNYSQQEFHNALEQLKEKE